jgi:hypothetical protein
MLTCSPYKRKLKEYLKKRKLFQPGKQETGNKEASKKVKRDYGSLNIQAEAIEENGDQTENVICTHCIVRIAEERSLIKSKAR